MTRAIIAILLALTLCACVPAFAAEPFDAQARLKDAQARFTANRQQAAALDREAAAIQKEAEALQEVLRLQAPPEKPVTPEKKESAE